MIKEIEKELEDFSLEQETVYRCKQCNNPDIVFADLENAKQHSENCLFNPKRKSCVLCKHLKVIEYPPYPRFLKTYLSSETYHAFGAYKQPYCMFKEQNIDEGEIFSKEHDECFEYSEEEAVTEWTPEFEKYMDLITKHGEQEAHVTDSELEDLILEDMESQDK